RVTHRKRTRRSVRKNVGELVVATLGNPARRKRRGAKSMAKARRRRRNASPRRHHRRVAHRRHRRNPIGGSWGTEITQALYIIAGAVGSKLGAQMILGSKNTGF